MRTLTLVFALLGAWACGSSDGGAADGGTPDAALPPDAAAVDGPAPAIDAGEPDAPSSLGRLCATTADGGPGDCPGAVCCGAGGTTVCRLPSDCEDGPGYLACTTSTECQGSICCKLPGMQFCTKPSACNAYGGEMVP